MACSRSTERCRTARSYQHETSECCKILIRECVDHFAEVAAELGVVWWMDYGTLLGAVRNQGIVPHDKDADLGMEGHQWEMLLNYRPEIPWRDGKTTFRPTLIREIDGFQWVLKKPRTTSNRARYEFSGGHSLKIRASKKNHTNVDIFPWYLDARNRYGRKRYISCDRFKGRDFHKDKLLPLTTLMWEGRMLPAPRDAEWMCAHRYGGAWQTPLRRNNDGMIR